VDFKTRASHVAAATLSSGFFMKYEAKMTASRMPLFLLIGTAFQTDEVFVCDGTLDGNGWRMIALAISGFIARL